MAKLEMLGTAVLTVKRNRPSWVISTQQGAVCWSAKGDDPMDVRSARRETLKAETVPFPGPAWALETNNWVGLVGRNSLPKGPILCAGNGDPGAGINRPWGPTLKLSMSDVPTRVPARCVPSRLNSTSP